MATNYLGIFHFVVAVEHIYKRKEVEDAFNNYNNLLKDPTSANGLSHEEIVMSAQILSTISHERFHFWQMAGTSFGYTLRSLEFFKIRFFLGRILNIYEKSKKYKNLPIKIPFIRTYATEDNSLIQNEMISCLKRWIFYETSIGSVFSQDSKSVPSSGESIEMFHDLREFLAKFNSNLRLPDGFWEFLGIESYPQLDSVSSCPTYEESVLGLDTIWESMSNWGANAHIVGLMERLGNNIPKSVHEKLSQLCMSQPEKYHNAFKFIIEKINEPKAYWLLFIASDIACMTPLSPGCESYCKGLTWQDLNPAWRFKKIIDAISEIGMPKNPFLNYDSFANKICDHLGWPSLSDIVNVGVKTSGDAVGEKDFFLYKEACKLRLEIPHVFCMPMNSAFATKIENTLGVPLHILQDGLYVKHLSTLDQVARYLQYKIVRTILFDGELKELRELCNSPYFREAYKAMYSVYFHGCDLLDPKILYEPNI